MRRLAAAVCATGLLAGGAAAFAAPPRAAPSPHLVGQVQAATTDASAGLRDPHGRPTVRLTVWYPAAAGARMQPIVVGPPPAPLFTGGAAASDAPWADGPPHPLIVVSHGFGGSARQMAWIGTALAQRGYVVVAMDHPGQNGADGITPAAVVTPWLRTDDVKAAIDWALNEPVVKLHVDPRRLGVLGFSQGGYTALSIAGARSDTDHFLAFCAATPRDAICQAPKENPQATPANMLAQARARPELVAAAAHAHDDHSDPRVRAVFAIAPAPVQLLDPSSLSDIRVPVAILLGDADPVATPATNGLQAASALQGRAELTVLSGVGHYDFLDECTAAGRAQEPDYCGATLPQAQTHARAVDAADAFFRRTLIPAAGGR